MGFGFETLRPGCWAPLQIPYKFPPHVSQGRLWGHLVRQRGLAATPRAQRPSPLSPATGCTRYVTALAQAFLDTCGRHREEPGPRRQESDFHGVSLSPFQTRVAFMDFACWGDLEGIELQKLRRPLHGAAGQEGGGAGKHHRLQTAAQNFWGDSMHLKMVFVKGLCCAFPETFLF